MRPKAAQLILWATLMTPLPAAAEDVERDATRPASAPATTQAVDPLFEPTRVSLKIADVEALDAITQLAKAAQVSLGDVPDDVLKTMKLHRLNGSFDRVPLLDALKELCSQAEVEPIFLRLPDGRAMLSLRIPKRTFIDGGRPVSEPTGKLWTRCPSVLSGPVMFALVSASTQSSVDLRADAPRRGPPNPPGSTMGPALSYQLVVLPEPKLDIVATSTARIVEAIDETGAVIPMRGRNSFPLQDFRSEQMNQGVSFRLPRPDVQRIALLRGVMRVRMAVRRETVSVPVDLGQPELVPAPHRDKAVAGFRLRVEPLVKGRGIGPNGADMFELRYTVLREGKSDTEWDKLTNDLGFARPQLVDEDGLALHQLSNRADRKTPTEVTQSRQLVRVQRGRPDRGEPRRVVWSVPVETEEIEIPFEFRDLPVPR